MKVLTKIVELLKPKKGDATREGLRQARDEMRKQTANIEKIVARLHAKEADQ